MRKNSLTFVTLFYWLKFLGLNPLKLSKGNGLKFSYFGLVHGCLLSAIGSYVLYGIVIGRSEVALPGDSPIGQIVDFVGIIGGFLESALMWLSFRFFQNRARLTVESFLEAQKISVKLGISKDSEKHLRQFGLRLLMVNCLYASFLILTTSVTKHYSNYSVLLWILFGMIRLSSLNMMTIFLSSFLTVKQNLRQLNDKVRFVMRNPSDDEVSPRSTRHSSRGNTVISDRIETISQVHRQLRDVIDRIQEHCGAFVACNVITWLTTLTINVHILYQFLKRHSSPITASDIPYVFVVLVWIFLPGLILTLISNVCGSLSDEANETGNILHATLNDRDNSGDTEAAAKLHLLSMELLKNRVKISILGCLDLDQFFIYSTIGTAAAYLMMMLQFSN